jgi:hypothetical protein
MMKVDVKEGERRKSKTQICGQRFKTKQIETVKACVNAMSCISH